MCVCIYKPIWSNVLFKAIVFLLIFCLDDIAIGKTGVLKSPKIVVLLSVVCFSLSVQFSRLVMSNSLWPHGLQHARPPCPSTTPGVYANSCPLSVYANSCPLSQWCHPTISSSVFPFSTHLQSFPASGSFQMNHFFASGGQTIGVSVSASVLPVNIQDWFPLGWTGLISLQSKGLSRIFSNTTVQEHQFFSAQLSL